MVLQNCLLLVDYFQMILEVILSTDIVSSVLEGCLLEPQQLGFDRDRYVQHCCEDYDAPSMMVSMMENAENSSSQNNKLF